MANPALPLAGYKKAYYLVYRFFRPPSSVEIMKVLTTAVALAFLASEAQAWNHVWYWCGRDRNTCFNKGKPYDGVYPTAKCGQKEGWDNYDKAHGKWYMTTDEMNDFTKVGGFASCCHLEGKSGCYDNQT
ncbi:uncharacterized protein FRV6_02721 [Fusarium oxysporum]|uniref:Uncharacterized protein n=1 Tax=Fusarium oxysporum TaxID=5507 RepID=A0A2H3SPW5_FUSOX|nr:uncharacterized protein FRV6_02721 [Fusarium oxysporum]